MKSALAIRHVHFEDLGIFGPALSAAGYTIRYNEAGVDPSPQNAVETTDMLVVLGGPISAYEEDKYPFLLETLRILERRLASGLPTIGICLGAQLMARALGARVYPGPAKEIGWASISLTQEGTNSPLKHLRNTPVLHWHGDTFDLPANATRLASTDLTPNQAFSYESHSLAIQFHPEISADNFERWLIGHACEIGTVPGLSVAALREDTCRYAGALSGKAAQLLVDFLDDLKIASLQPNVNENA